jgi:hypothetical protein
LRKNRLIYALVLVICGAGIASVLAIGANFAPDADFSGHQSQHSARDAPLIQPQGTNDRSISVSEATTEIPQNSLPILLLQVMVIILTARAIGWLFVKIGQPVVVGEMLAGIVLGPSLLGSLFPGEAFLFPTASMGTLQLLSQLGVIIFMFGIGLELHLGSLRQQAHAAVFVSHASILAPFFLGVAFSLAMYPALAGSDVPFFEFALFMGIAMSITAFPVLARIIEERGLAGTHLGNTAIACAAIGDATAWCILAVIVAIASATEIASALLTVFLSLCFVGVMLLVISPRAARIVHHLETSRTASSTGLYGYVDVRVRFGPDHRVNRHSRAVRSLSGRRGDTACRQGAPAP